MNRPRSRASKPASCDCARAAHVHGTAVMYQNHRCGCSPCTHAYGEYRTGRRGFSEADPTPVRGLFVATFPYYGGLSPQRLRRILRSEVAALAAEQGVRVLAGDLRVRVDRTGAGEFVAVAVPAETSIARTEVDQRAAEFAWRHEHAHPQLAAALTSSIDEEAA